MILCLALANLTLDSFDRAAVGHLHCHPEAFPRLFCIKGHSLFVSDDNAEDIRWLAEQGWSVCGETRVPQPHGVRVCGQTGRIHAEGQAHRQQREGQGIARSPSPRRGLEQDWQVGRGDASSTEWSLLPPRPCVQEILRLPARRVSHLYTRLSSKTSVSIALIPSVSFGVCDTATSNSSCAFVWNA